MLRILESTIVLDNHFVKITEEKVRLPNGVINDYYIVTSKSDRAMVLPMLNDGRIILVNEYRHGCRDYVWQLPAGCVDGEEAPEEAARRELLEETGYVAEKLEFLGSWYVSPPRMPDKMFAFIGHGCLPGEDPDHILKRLEDVKALIVDWETAVEMVVTNKIKDPHSCAIILWAERLQGRRENDS